jgi:SAM-dependent methyltransferase
LNAYPWQYDESVQVGTDYRDEGEVQRYDERMHRLRNIAGEIDTVRQAIEISGEMAVFEIGTGTGDLALGLARHCRHVFAVDVSQTMLSFAENKARRRGTANVSFHCGGFLSGFRPPGLVDAVVSQLALHHLPDFWKRIAVRRAWDVLKPGGRLYLRDVVFPSAVEDYDTYFSAAVEEMRSKAGDEMAQSLVAHIQKEFSTLDWILEGMLARTGFRILRKDVDGLLTTYNCVK